MAKIADSDRTTHLYVVGATGTGKTKFLEFLIRQDINRGHGFGVVDPHGDLFEDVKGYLAWWRASLATKTSATESSSSTRPTHSSPSPSTRSKICPASRSPSRPGAGRRLRKIWSDSWGARMEDLLRNTLIALGEAELTLAELPRFLTAESLRIGS